MGIANSVYPNFHECRNFLKLRIGEGLALLPPSRKPMNRKIPLLEQKLQVYKQSDAKMKLLTTLRRMRVNITHANYVGRVARIFKSVCLSAA